MGRTGERWVSACIIVLGVSQLALGVWQAVAPGSFFRAIGGFGPRNDHYIRDVSTWYVALGVVLLLAVRRRSWRVPVLFLAVLQYALHLVNHLVDVGKAEPGWAGPADVVSLLLTGALFALVLGAAVRERRTEHR